MMEVLLIIIAVELAVLIVFHRPQKSGQKKVRVRRKEKRRLQVQMKDEDKKLWKAIGEYNGGV